MDKGYMYILQCSNGKYYVGSTKNLVQRMREHCEGLGSNFTIKYAPFILVYYEEYPHVAEAFDREQQIHGWSRKKKEALIQGRLHDLPLLAECQNITHYQFREMREYKSKFIDSTNSENQNENPGR